MYSLFKITRIICQSNGDLLHSVLQGAKTAHNTMHINTMQYHTHQVLCILTVFILIFWSCYLLYGFGESVFYLYMVSVQGYPIFIIVHLFKIIFYSTIFPYTMEYFKLLYILSHSCTHTDIVYYPQLQCSNGGFIPEGNMYSLQATFAVICLVIVWHHLN